jgi:hypothetical protein
MISIVEIESPNAEKPGIDCGYFFKVKGSTESELYIWKFMER